MLFALFLGENLIKIREQMENFSTWHMPNLHFPHFFHGNLAHLWSRSLDFLLHGLLRDESLFTSLRVCNKLLFTVYACTEWLTNYNKETKVINTVLLFVSFSFFGSIINYFIQKFWQVTCYVEIKVAPCVVVKRLEITKILASREVKI